MGLSHFPLPAISQSIKLSPAKKTSSLALKKEGLAALWNCKAWRSFKIYFAEILLWFYSTSGVNQKTGQGRLEVRTQYFLGVTAIDYNCIDYQTILI